MKKLIFTFALAIFLMPCVVNAYTLGIHEVQERWIDNGLQYRKVTDIKDFNSFNINFRGDVYTGSLLRSWPYSYTLYYLNTPTFDISKTYDLDFIAFSSFSDGISAFARVNGNNNCNTVSVSNYISYFSCKNITLVNNAYNYIIVSFTNNGVSSKSFSYGLSTLNFVESGTSNRDDILNYISILDDNIKNQNQAIIDNQDKNNQEQIENANKNHQQTIDTITSDDVSGASSTGSGFFDSFNNNDHGLSGIVTAPLRIVNGLVSTKKCYSIPVTIMNKTVFLPCSSYVTEMKGFDYFYYIYNLLVGGLLCYYCCCDIFRTTEKLKNPDDDKVEVMDL